MEETGGRALQSKDPQKRLGQLAVVVCFGDEPVRVAVQQVGSERFVALGLFEDEITGDRGSPRLVDNRAHPREHPRTEPIHSP